MYKLGWRWSVYLALHGSPVWNFGAEQSHIYSTSSRAWNSFRTFGKLYCDAIAKEMNKTSPQLISVELPVIWYFMKWVYNFGVVRTFEHFGFLKMSIWVAVQPHYEVLPAASTTFEHLVRQLLPLGDELVYALVCVLMCSNRKLRFQCTFPSKTCFCFICKKCMQQPNTISNSLHSFSYSWFFL